MLGEKERLGMADQKQFLDFLDMIDGGGAGRRGDTFEGGGLYSILANTFATPYGSEDEARRAKRDEFFGVLDMALGATGPKGPSGAGQTAMPRPQARPSAEDRLMQLPVTPMSAEDRLMQQPVVPMSAEDRLMQNSLTANPMYAQAAAEMGMGLNPFGNTQPPNMPQAPMQGGNQGQPSFGQFVTMQKQFEAQMGMQPMSQLEYMQMYHTLMQQMGN